MNSDKKLNLYGIFNLFKPILFNTLYNGPLHRTGDLVLKLDVLNREGINLKAILVT